ncbi:MAG: serine/threonine-protein phosphatase [Methylomonas sp.]|nr:serine/threonine-protein phosphatase [Methylomonas sp.]
MPHILKSELVRVRQGYASHLGLRSEQQDVFALSDFSDAEFVSHGGYLALVADGIGGLQYGAEAAGIATTRFMADYTTKSVEQSVDDALDQAMIEANNAVCNTARYLLNCPGRMGTTLLAALIYREKFHWRSVGDSHLYLCRGGGLTQLNPDQIFARQLQILVSAGIINQSYADKHPQRYALEGYLGLESLPAVERNWQAMPLCDGDKLLLCTDGVYGVLSAVDMLACLRLEPKSAAQRLCDTVLLRAQPNQDNLTAVVLAYQM